MTIECYKEEIQRQADLLVNETVFINNRFVKIQDIKIDFEMWSRTSFLLDDMKVSFSDVYSSHSNLYFEKIKIDQSYNKDDVRKMYFKLNNIRNKIEDLVTIERICCMLTNLGIADGCKRKLSAIGNYFVNGKQLSSKALTRFRNENRTNFNLNDFVEFKESYMMNYEVTKEEFEEVKQTKNKNKRYAKNAVENSYSGNVDELIEWLKDNVEYIQVRVPAIKIEDYEEFVVGGKNNVQKSIAEIKQRVIDSTEELINEAKDLGFADSDYSAVEVQGLYSAWILKLKNEAKDSVPVEMRNWVYLKKKPQDLENYEEDFVYREKQNMITGNPIVKDLVFGYGLRLTNKD